MTFSITTLCTNWLFATFSITILFCCTECHNAECRILFMLMLNVIMLGVILLYVIMLSVIMLSVIMPSVIMPSVIMPSVIMPSVVAPKIIIKNWNISNPGMQLMLSSWKPRRARVESRIWSKPWTSCSWWRQQTGEKERMATERSRSQCYKTFFLCCWRRGQIS